MKETSEATEVKRRKRRGLVVPRLNYHGILIIGALRAEDLRDLHLWNERSRGHTSSWAGSSFPGCINAKFLAVVMTSRCESHLPPSHCPLNSPDLSPSCLFLGIKWSLLELSISHRNDSRTADHPHSPSSNV